MIMADIDFLMAGENGWTLYERYDIENEKCPVCGKITASKTIVKREIVEVSIISVNIYMDSHQTNIFYEYTHTDPAKREYERFCNQPNVFRTKEEAEKFFNDKI